MEIDEGSQPSSKEEEDNLARSTKRNKEGMRREADVGEEDSGPAHRSSIL